MQLAGALCKICNSKILMQMDATWCARCNSAFHRACIERDQGFCPACRQAFDRPQNHFVYSKYCSECMRLNDPPKATCAACGTSTCWDNRSQYEAFVEHMKDTSRVYLVRAVAELGLGSLCLFLLVVLLITNTVGIRTLFLLVLGLIILIPRGILTIRRSRIIGRFE